MNYILDYLKSNLDINYKAFIQKLTPDTNLKIIGVRTPIIKRLAKELTANFSNKIPMFLQEKHCFFEETLLHGFLLGYIKDIDILLLYLNNFLNQIDNWAVCDQTVSALKIIKKYPDKVLSQVIECLKSDKPYTVRFAIVILLNYFLDKNFKENIYFELEKVKSDNYYVNMALAWFYSIALIKQLPSSIKIIQAKTLPKFVQNKAIQKACESFRINNNLKHQLKTYKL